MLIYRKPITRLLIFISLLTGLVALSGCSAFTEHSIGLQSDTQRNDQRLTPCPHWPRCVSSDSSRESHYIEAFTLMGNPQAAWQQAIIAVRNMPRTRVITENAVYLHAEIDSPWDFYIDDLELHFRPQQQKIAVRSSGRIGYYDFAVNQKRIEALRQTLIQQGLVAPLQR